MGKTGYQIQGKDGANAFSDDQNQFFETLEEAMSWKEAFWESVMDAVGENDEMPEKSDYVIAYYKDGVQRGDYPLFQ